MSECAIVSSLQTVSPLLAPVPGLQVFLVWDPAARRDVAWLTLLDQEDFPGGISSLGHPITLARTGLGFREWNLKAAARGEEEGVVRRLRLVMQPLVDRAPWRVLLAWDSDRNSDCGWLSWLDTPSSPLPSPAYLSSSLELRYWNLSPAPTTSPVVDIISMILSIHAPTSHSPQPSPSLPPPSTSTGSQPPDTVPCTVCYKNISRKGLKVHMNKMHSVLQTTASQSQSLALGPASSLGPGGSSRETGAPSLNAGPSNVDAEASRLDLVVSSLDSGVSMSLDNSLAGLPVSSPPTVQGPPSTTPGSQEAGKPEDQGEKGAQEAAKCSIFFKYRAKKLKLKTLFKRPMSRAMAEFAKHRGLQANNLRFHLQGTEEEVDRGTNAGQYDRKTVLVTDA